MGRKLNMLFVLTDDQRFDTVGALGNPHIKTPNIDRLVNEGFSFRQNFCTTPICTPARAEILTGCTSFVNRVPWFGMAINPELTLLPRAFKDAGYHTIHVGKWHNDGHPRDKGYDVTSCVFHNDNLNNHAKTGHYMRFKEPWGEVSGHSSEIFTDSALRLLENAPADKPWFCFLAYHAPHDPFDAPEPFASMYDPEKMPLYPNYMPEHPVDNGDMTIRDELLENWPRTQERMRRYRAKYYGMISHMDFHFGRVLDFLKSKGLDRNTVVVFTGDQGLATGSHGLLGKENMYDHSISSPLIWRGPSIPRGKTSSALVHHVDLYPTLCEIAGIPKPASAKHGHNLVPLIEGKVREVREDVFCEFFSPEDPHEELRHSQRLIRTERWKLIWYPLISRYQLFNIGNDPCELVDLIAPWRCRRRAKIADGKKIWTKDAWSAPDEGPQYSRDEIKEVVGDLHKRLLRQMELNEDPLLLKIKPPPPDMG